MRLFKNTIAIVLIIFGVVYIVNPTAGVLEFIPDNLPFIGNVDEAAIVYTMIAALRFLGADLTKSFNQK